MDVHAGKGDGYHDDESFFFTSDVSPCHTMPALLIYKLVMSGEN